MLQELALYSTDFAWQCGLIYLVVAMLSSLNTSHILSVLHSVWLLLSVIKKLRRQLPGNPRMYIVTKRIVLHFPKVHTSINSET